MKRPAFQFYPGDWLRDTALRSCSVAARGLWIDLLCYMHDGTPYGHLAVNGKALTSRRLAQMVGLDLKAFNSRLRELEAAKVLARTSHGTIYSRRMVRDEEIRLKRAVGGIKSIEHPNTPKPKGTLRPILQGTHEGRAEGSNAGPPPASASAVASAESQLHGGASRRAGANGGNAPDDPTFRELMGLVRKQIYVPDGEPPADWDVARDGSILKELLKRREPTDVAIAIEGLAILRDFPGVYADAVDWPYWPQPGQKTDLRPLYNNRSGALDIFALAIMAYWKHANTRAVRPENRGPVRIGDVATLRKAVAAT